MAKTVKHNGEELEIKFSHTRRTDENENILPRGGITTAWIEIKDDNEEILRTIARHAKCSVKDNFSKRIGREIAEGRLRKALNEKED